jgi:hypothetical protein
MYGDILLYICIKSLFLDVMTIEHTVIELEIQKRIITKYASL